MNYPFNCCHILTKMQLVLVKEQLGIGKLFFKDEKDNSVLTKLIQDTQNIHKPFQAPGCACYKYQCKHCRDEIVCVQKERVSSVVRQ